MTERLPKVVKNSLLTMNNIHWEWSGEDKVYVSYPKSKPSDEERVELMFSRRPDGKWRLYSCSENFADAQWERVQAYLMTNQ